MRTPVVLFELNEVPARVMRDYAERRPQSAIAALLKAGSMITTTCPDSGHLSPWVTWPTLHRGVPDTVHGIRHLGQDLHAAREWPPVWELAARGGASVGVFGSLHSWPPPADAGRYAFFVPDPFAPEADVVPATLGDFQAFNLAMSRASGRNVAAGLPLREAARAGACALRHGLRLRTLLRAAEHLMSERVSPWRRLRRRTWQSVVAFDLFLHLWRQDPPDFATFFTNHVASAMHRYWAAAWPEDYAEALHDEDWVRRYRGEIDFAIGHTDRMLGALMRAMPEPGVLLVASSMGQAATRARKVRTQLYLRDQPRFMAALGVPAGAWAARPAMEPDFSVHVEVDHADTFAAGLAELRVNGEPLTHARREGTFFSISFGQEDLPQDAAAAVGGKAVRLAELGLQNVEIEDQAATTAYHIPEGILLAWSKSELPNLKPDALTTQIAPTILSLLNQPAPTYTPEPLWQHPPRLRQQKKTQPPAECVAPPSPPRRCASGSRTGAHPCR
jgi:hypothetical protein